MRFAATVRLLYGTDNARAFEEFARELAEAGKFPFPVLSLGDAYEYVVEGEQTYALDVAVEVEATDVEDATRQVQQAAWTRRFPVHVDYLDELPLSPLV